MALQPVRRKKRTKKKAAIGRRRRKFLFSPDVAQGFRDDLLNKMEEDIYKLKKKALEKDADPFRNPNVWRMDCPYIKSRVLECIPTRDVRLDIALAEDMDGVRGLPRGKIIEISGPNEQFKSARMYNWFEAFQNDPRGAIIVLFETESKAGPKWINAAGCNVSQMFIEQPDFIEAAYYSMMHWLNKYQKERDKAIVAWIKKRAPKSMTNMEFEKHLFLGAMSFPPIVFGYDSVGNHASMLSWQKSESGKTTKTPGAHAAAHAEGLRLVKTRLGTLMGTLILINHTKDVIDMTGGGFGKPTDTYGGKAIKYMSDIRIEQKAGVGHKKTSIVDVTRRGKKIIIGKWVTVRFLKNSIVETSRTQVEHILFSYKYGFNMGTSFLQALDTVDGAVKGQVQLNPNKRTKLNLPNGDTVEVTMDEFHRILLAKPKLREKFRDMIMQQAARDSVLVREDV